MAALLLVASATIYTVQRRQLYRALDQTLSTTANVVASLVHPGPFGYWFDAEALERLPTDGTHQRALFEIWSDQPLSVGPIRGRAESQPSWRSPAFCEENSSVEPPFRSPDDPFGPRRTDRAPHALQPGRVGQSRGRESVGRHDPVTGLFVIRSPLLSVGNLPYLEPSGSRSRFADIVLPDGSLGRAAGLRFVCTDPGPTRLPPASLVTVVAASLAETHAQLRFLASLLIVTAAGTMAVAGAVAWLVVGRGLRPLVAVAQDIATINESDLKRRIDPARVPPELQIVVGQLNGLLQRLDAAFERERTLSADVAHELRTPIAEIRAIAEITLQRLRRSEEYRQALGEVLEAVRAVEGLIERLLMLARLEAGQTKPELQPLRLKNVLVQRWAQFRNAAAAAGLEFEERCPEEAVVGADPKLLEVVLSNALSNAVTYTPAGGRVAVGLERTGSTWRLSIVNTGCALREEDISRVFDRFWRADPARRRSGLNCGLGLPLVRRAMQAMGGEALAQVTPRGEFVLTLVFQRATNPL